MSVRFIIVVVAALAAAQPASAAYRHHYRGVTGDPVGIVAHPTGCPRTEFCGCGVSVRVFGHSVRTLWLARAWLRFPRATAAPGTVAVFRGGGHVAYVEVAYGDGTALVYDPNSGGHQTRVHRRSLAGAVIVSPRGA